MGNPVRLNHRTFQTRPRRARTRPSRNRSTGALLPAILAPLSDATVINLRDPQLPPGQQTVDRWFNTCTLLANGQRSNCASADEPITWVQMTNSYQLRSYDDRFPNIRNQWATQVNMSVFKNFAIKERVNFQFRAEAFNAFNTPIYQGPDTGLTSNSFGRVTIAQQNFPRSMQFAFRLSF